MRNLSALKVRVFPGMAVPESASSSFFAELDRVEAGINKLAEGVRELHAELDELEQGASV